MHNHSLFIYVFVYLFVYLLLIIATSLFFHSIKKNSLKEAYKRDALNQVSMATKVKYVSIG